MNSQPNLLVPFPVGRIDWFARFATSLCCLIAFVSLSAPSAHAQSSTGCALTSWQIRPALVTVLLRDATYNPSRGFIAVGDYGALLTSADGENWTTTSLPQSVFLARVHYENGLYTAMGRQFGSTELNWSAVLWTSSDAVNWTPRFSATNSVVYGMATGNGTHVAVVIDAPPGGSPSARSLVSPDGINWSAGGAITQGWLYNIAYGNGLFVVVGGNQIFASDDGISWTQAVSPSGKPLQSVSFQLGQFFAVGEGGLILSSPDGLEWSAQNSGSSAFLSGISGGGDLVAVVGDDGTVLTSRNGTDWEQKLGSLLDLRGIAYGADTFVAVGKYGAVYQSGGIQSCGGVSLKLTRDTQSHLGLTGTVGTRFRIEYTDQIGDPWVILREITSLPTSPYEIIDAAPSPTGQRFYRAIQLP